MTRPFLALFRSVLVLLALVPRPALADVEVKIDGWSDGDLVAYQAGFGIGEYGAVRLTPPSPNMQLKKVRFLFAGSSELRTVTLHVWDDGAGTMAPGQKLYTNYYSVSGSNSAWQEVDLSADGIVVPGDFRVGIESDEAGAPNIVRDVDDSIDETRNFLYGNCLFGVMWQSSFDCGLTGDWVIRATLADIPVIQDAGPVTTDASVPDAAIAPVDAGMLDAAPPVVDACQPVDAATRDAGQDVMPDTGHTPPDAGLVTTDAAAVDASVPAGTCQVNAECDVGSYCDPTAHRCTFDCRSDGDCSSGGDCNSLGQCVGQSRVPESNETEADTGPCACSSVDHHPAWLTVVTLLLLMRPVQRRRRV
jgi:hypothetical protein